jgi:hypothetical protein
MNINENALRQAARETLLDVNKSIAEIERQAKRMGTEPHIIRDEHGNWTLTPLLAAKAQLLHSLVLLQTKEG